MIKERYETAKMALGSYGLDGMIADIEEFAKYNTIDIVDSNGKLKVELDPRVNESVEEGKKKFVSLKNRLNEIGDALRFNNKGPIAQEYAGKFKIMADICEYFLEEQKTKDKKQNDFYNQLESGEFDPVAYFKNAQQEHEI